MLSECPNGKEKAIVCSDMAQCGLSRQPDVIKESRFLIFRYQIKTGGALSQQMARIDSACCANEWDSVGIN